MLKRLFDIIFSFLSIILFLPAFLVIALIIKLGSKGPVFYRGTRVGQYGKLIKPYKFRTMVEGAEELGSSTTAEGDPRITKVGRFLRKYKIDEFPQLINVLKGEMSFVGPRPELEEHVRCYNEEEKIILTVKPGMTDYSCIKFISLDKVVGNENVDEVYIRKVRSEKNQLRIKYAKDHSFFGDLKIIVKSLLVILKKIRE